MANEASGVHKQCMARLIGESSMGGDAKFVFLVGVSFAMACTNEGVFAALCDECKSLLRTLNEGRGPIAIPERFRRAR